MKRVVLLFVSAGLVIALAVLAFALDPPHDWNTVSVPPDPNQIECSDCHKVHNAVGGAITAVAGNANLCQTCHQSGGLARNKPMANTDEAFPSPGLSSWSDLRGTSHRWDSGASGHVKADDVTPNKATGTVQSSGAFIGRYSKTYTVTITTSGNVGTAYFAWTATTPPGGSGPSTVIQTSATPGVSAAMPLDEGISLTFTDGSSPATCGFAFCVNDKWRVYVRTDINQPSTAAMAARLSGGKIMCSTCHNQHSQSQTPFDPLAPAYAGSGTGAGRHFQRVSNDVNQMCTDCHSARNVTLSAQGSHPVGVSIPGTGFFKSPATLPLDRTTSQVRCMTCHQPHYAASSDGALLRLANVTTLCTDCHTLADTSTPASHLNISTGVLWPGPGSAPYGPYGSTNYPQVTDSTKRGACTNCHQPHGWPDGASPSQDYPKLLVEQPDQRLCFVCHDANGPATSNVYGQFNGATNYQVTSASGAKVNQRHDITAADQAYSGGQVACLNCHDPHLATSTQRVIDPSTTARYSRTYAKTNSYTRNGYSWTYDGSGTNYDPMSPVGCSLLPRWEIGAAKPKFNGFTVVNTGNDTATSAGTYNPGGDSVDITYTVTVSRGGTYLVSRNPCTSANCPQITVTSTSNRDNSGPTDVTANQAIVPIGARGVTISFSDGSATGQGLTQGDQWTVDVYYRTACSTASEPDVIDFCLACHDKTNPPAGVVMPSSLTNIADAWGVGATGVSADKHGRTAGNTGSNGYMKVPWNNIAGQETSQPYAALTCTVCHDGHGSDNIYHLKRSITVRGVQMRVGGAGTSGFDETKLSRYGATDYLLPCFSGSTLVDCSTVGSTQGDHNWGAWCSFCHDMSTHQGVSETTSCRLGHMHGGGAF